MSQGSLKDTAKAIATTFASPTVPYPLPEELNHTIEAFLDKHQPTDEGEADRLHDELLFVYHRCVKSIAGKHGPFVKLLRLLQPAIAGERRLLDWWTLVIRPTVDAIGHKRDTIEDAKEFLLGILVYDDEEGSKSEKARISHQFIKRLLDIYLARTRIPTGEGEVVSPEDEFIAHDLESLLLAFGRKKPKELLTAIDALLAKKDRRLQALSLLSSFLRLQPPHLHLVMETDVIHRLLNCLLMDTCATVVDMALAVLIMFLPQITTSLVSILPKLFLVYARVLCWDFYNGSASENPSHSDDEKGPSSSYFGIVHADPNWEQLSQPSDGAEAVTPKPDYLFTFLYGLFPLNFTNFIRKPRRYLITAKYPNADVLDLNQGMIRTRTESQRSVHVLHPNFFTTTLEDELTDNKWLKADPADLVSECLGLCTAVSQVLPEPGPPPTTKLPEVPTRTRSQRSTTGGHTEDDISQTNDTTSPMGLRTSSQLNASSTTLTTQSSGSTDDQVQPAIKEQLSGLAADPVRSSGTSSPVTDREDDETNQKSRRRSQSKTMSPTPPRSSRSPNTGLSLGFQTTTPTPMRTSIPHSAQSNSRLDSTVVLQREIILLKNDLNFERYLKQQHLAHIAQLQRKHINEATVESDAQNLYHTNRALKAKLAKANDLYAQLKRETQTSRNQSKRYEEQLTSKVKAYREEEKQWKADIAALRHEHGELKQECERLQDLIEEATLREQHSQNQIINYERELEGLNSLREELESMKDKVRELEMHELDHAQMKENHEILSNDLQTAKLELASRDAEKERSKKAYEQKIAALEAKLRNSSPQPGHSGQLPSSVQQIIDSALAVSNSKLQQLRRSYTVLQQKYAELQRRNMELQAANATEQPVDPIDKAAYTDDAPYLVSGNRSAVKPSSSTTRRDGLHSTLGSVRRPHDFADPGLYVDDSVGGEEPTLDVAPPVSTSELSTSYSRETSERPRDPTTGRTTRYERPRNLRSQPVRSVSPPEERDRPDSQALPSAFEGRYMHDFQMRQPDASPHSSQSATSEAASAAPKAEPPQPQPQPQPARYGGRGGAQTTVKKPPKEKDGKDSRTKSGSFRGLRMM